MAWPKRADVPGVQPGAFKKGFPAVATGRASLTDSPSGNRLASDFGTLLHFSPERTMRKIGIVAPASHREDPNMLPVLRIKYPNPKPRKNETNAKPRRIDENSASTTLAAKIAA